VGRDVGRRSAIPMSGERARGVPPAPVIAIAGGAALATRLLDSGCDIRTAQEYLERSEVQTTYAHSSAEWPRRLQPVDGLGRVRHPSTPGPRWPRTTACLGLHNVACTRPRTP
jgi:hypothetical protein